MRQKIVEAARKRFTHFGYGKTTMAEVAGDCNMSSGNLYRYFPGKLDIAEEIGREATHRVMEEVRAVVLDAGPGAADKLRVYLRKMLEVSHGQIKYDSRVYEMVVILRRERPEFLTWQRNTEHSLVAEILAAGNRSGEFAVPDVPWMAETVLAASFKFHFPQIYTDTPLEQLRRELESLSDLILRGLAAPGLQDDAAARGRSALPADDPAYGIQL